MAVVRDATDSAPEMEVSSLELDFGIATSGDKVSGFQLSTGRLLWTQPFGDCSDIVFAGQRAYGACNESLRIFDPIPRADEEMAYASPEQRVLKIALSGRYLAIIRRSRASDFADREIEVLDTTTNALVASKLSEQVAELRGTSDQFLVHRPAGIGFCILGVPNTYSSKGTARRTYLAGCYDPQLKPLWSIHVPPPRGADAALAIRQFGPDMVVLDDQTYVTGSGRTSKGHGMTISWRDGTVSTVSDGTFATIHDQRGARLPARVVNATLERVRRLRTPRVRTSTRSAIVTRDGYRAFALVGNGRLALAGFDLESKKDLFLAPIQSPTSDGDTLEMAAGFPIVRSRYNDHWEVSIFDPASGKVVYKERRVASDIYY